MPCEGRLAASLRSIPRVVAFGGKKVSRFRPFSRSYLSCVCPGYDFQAQPRNGQLGPTIVLAGVDSGVSNALLADGGTLTDRVLELVRRSVSANRFLSDLYFVLLPDWVRKGLITPSERRAVYLAARAADLTGLIVTSP